MTTIKDLKCEYTVCPMGVQLPDPSLSFSCISEDRGKYQTAYEIAAASSPENLENGTYDLWYTGKVISRDSFDIRYNGQPLTSGQRVYWMVRIWDEQGNPTPFSHPSWFEMGLLDPADWKGRWLGFLGGLIGNGLQLRYTFTLKETPVKARAYVAGLGYYEFRMNGSKQGDELLEPGATDVSRTVLYRSYDILLSLRPGNNTLGLILGTGWYGTPKALMQMKFEYADGSVQEEFSDWGIGWYVAKGPILYNSIYDGEDYDARMEKDGWDTPEYEPIFQKEHQRPGGWGLATVTEAPGGKLTGNIMPPIRKTDSITPVCIHTYEDGRKLYDTGVNLSGWVRLKTSGDAGAKVTLTFSETLEDNMELDMSYLRFARCQDSYTLRGDRETEEYAPRFTYHGFRYFTVKVEGNAAIQSLEAEFIRSDMPHNASFSCSDPFLQKMADVMWHTDACNLHSIPTDCCQRDERHGWTTDTTSRTEGCTYHFDASAFFDKWFQDLLDTQDEHGYFADTAPHRWGRRPCDPQVNTPVSLPLLLYRTYGNKRVLEKGYSGLKEYMLSLLKESKEYIISRTGFGEWACPKSECYPEPDGAGAVSRHVDPSLVSTGYLHQSLRQMKEIAEILGNDTDAKWFEEQAQNVREQYNQKFFHEDTRNYDSGSQSSNALSMALGLVPCEYQKEVVDNIVKKVEEKDFHMTTGNMGTKALIEVLSQHGKADTVYALFSQKTSPSFGYMLEQGATSIWERWEADEDNNIMNSHNHPMLSACCVWFYKYLCGIQQKEDTAAFRDIVIAPVIPQALSWANVKMDTCAGTVVSSWKKEGGNLLLEVEIPFGANAVIRIPSEYAPESYTIYENGQMLPGQDLPVGVCSANVSTVADADYYEISVESGHYSFSITEKEA
ncbi:glycoside hydrolase family 78 protein [Blautia schinkii]|nr:glycoside hydrolase family 78 protein [Blautia schinkii]